MFKKKFKTSFKRCFNLVPPSQINTSLINDNTNVNQINLNSPSLTTQTKRNSSCCCNNNNNSFFNSNRYNLNYFFKIKLKQCTISLSIILMFYLFSITLTFYNRMLFVTYKYPLSITIIHLIIKFILSMIMRNCYYICKSQSRIMLNWNLYLKRIIPTGIASALDIGLSNWSLQYITVALYTMSKSTVILFILLFALLFKLEKWQWSLAIVAICISIGLLLFTYHSTEFNLFGFILVMIASLLSGLRWTLAQIVTQKNEIGLSNPIDMMYHIQPGMILALLPLAVYVEGVSVMTTDKFFRNSDFSTFLHHTLLIVIGSILAFCLESSEFLVVSHTSSLTLSISGIFKEICTMYIAIKINDNQLNTINAIGLCICIFGIIIHVIIKARQQIIKPDEESENNNKTATNQYRTGIVTKRSHNNSSNSYELDEYSHNLSSNLLSNQVY